MFFIVPDRNENRTTSNSSSASLADDLKQPPRKRQRHDHSEDNIGGYYPKRISKACDRCRLKKAKCTGGKICAKCHADGVVCVTNTVSKKSTKAFNPEYLQLVESQRDRLVEAVSKLVHDQDAVGSSSLVKVLREMGISTHKLSPPTGSPVPSTEGDAAPYTDLSPSTWATVFDSLDQEDLTAIESLSAEMPQLSYETFLNHHAIPLNPLVWEAPISDFYSTEQSSYFDDQILGTQMNYMTTE